MVSCHRYPLSVSSWSTSGRVFGYEQLVRSMLGITIWLGLCAVLGIVNGTARIVQLARRARRE